ncbi:hypothetical protein QF035_011012 [Streptomyces umbrinus]|uniref:Transposase n=1 Tax=Streptomyces umbrinus TaxID=67370 RepID=A0ABU0TC86_9ACTN|nr:hypothetical protein [Streptomyces umbrinus]
MPTGQAALASSVGYAVSSSYSPELNPDELVNADLKRSLPHTHRARNQTELASETRRFFHRRQRQPHIVRGYFGGRHVRYVIDEWTP